MTLDPKSFVDYEKIKSPNMIPWNANESSRSGLLFDKNKGVSPINISDF